VRRAPLLLAVLALPRLALALGADTPPQVPPAALRDCASIVAAAERLACYDRLAGQAAGNVTAAAPQPAAAPAPPAAITPPPATAPPATTAAAPAAAVAAPAAPGSAVPAPQSFGAYEAEHPRPPPVAKSLDASVIALGRSPSGRMTVSLQGGALWELADSDPLLAVGDVVTITRASLGSYLLHTPSQRVHRAYRLQ
jgi:hypothetical protein